MEHRDVRSRTPCFRSQRTGAPLEVIVQIVDFYRARQHLWICRANLSPRFARRGVDKRGNQLLGNESRTQALSRVSRTGLFVDSAVIEARLQWRIRRLDCTGNPAGRWLTVKSCPQSKSTNSARLASRSSLPSRWGANQRFTAHSDHGLEAPLAQSP